MSSLIHYRTQTESAVLEFKNKSYYLGMQSSFLQSFEILGLEYNQAIIIDTRQV